MSTLESRVTCFLLSKELCGFGKAWKITSALACSCFFYNGWRQSRQCLPGWPQILTLLHRYTPFSLWIMPHALNKLFPPLPHGIIEIKLIIQNLICRHKDRLSNKHSHVWYSRCLQGEAIPPHLCHAPTHMDTSTLSLRQGAANIRTQSQLLQNCWASGMSPRTTILIPVKQQDAQWFWEQLWMEYKEAHFQGLKWSERIW